MNSFESRLKTFKNWKGPKKESQFAITGLYSLCIKDFDETICVFCSKSLVGWDDNDVPCKEHYEHSKKCPMYNLNDAANRRRTFDFCHNKIHVSDASVLSKSGFFAYSFLDNFDDYLCYKCGFCVERSDDVENATIHFNLCENNRLSEVRFDCKDEEVPFFVDFLKGKFNKNIEKYVLGVKRDFEMKIDEKLEDLILTSNEINHVLTLGEYLNEKGKKNLKLIDKIIQKSIEKSVDEIDK